MKAERIILTGLALVIVGVAGAWYYENSSSAALDQRRFEFTYTARLPALPPGAETLRLWLPLPRDDENQDITALALDSPVPYQRLSEPVYGNEFLYLELNSGELRRTQEITLRFHVTRREHRAALPAHGLAARAAPAREDPRGLARHLQPDRLVPLDGIIAELSAQATRGLTDPLDKARAIYDYVVSTLTYEKAAEGAGRGDALFACDAKRGNCTDFHALFIGMMRAAGIPARFEIGFPLPAGQLAGEIDGYHCWAQFYLEPYGWIPVDASEAWKDPARRDYFFGAHDPHRVLFSFGRDIHLRPPQDGLPLNFFIYPYAELDGRELQDIQTEFLFRNLLPEDR